MGIGRTISLIVFALVAIQFAAISFGEQFGLWDIPLSEPAVAVPVAAVAAGFVALVFWVTVGMGLDFAIGRIGDRIDGDGDDDKPDRSQPLWLRSLNKRIDQHRKALQNEIDQLRAERRELEIQVRVVDAERQHAEAILQSISDAVLVTDAFNEVAIANEAAAEALRFCLEDARHQPIDQVVGDQSLVKLIRDTRESGSLANRRHFEHRVQHNGRSSVFDVSLSCVANQQHEVAGVVTILHDVTKEKEISAMKSDFVSSVSHELRTPLSSIKAYVEMLVDGEAEDEQTRTEFYNIIQSEANRLSRLIDNILNISRIESGIQKVQREHISLPSVIREVVEVMQPQARAKRIELTVADSPLYYEVYADKDMVYQAMLNLVGNALKYTPEGGRVSIDTVMDEHGRTVEVNVHDTGVGIPADALPHLFEKFYRVADHKNIAKGTGLGLNLVKHIVETVHHGRLTVRSEVGAGSTFTMSLPVSDGAYA